MKTTIPARTPFQGLAQIFNYNRPFYLRTLAGVTAALLLSIYSPPVFRILILLAVVPALFWSCSSLLVSHYVYDRSDLYQLSWLRGCLSRPPARWVNIHAGLDENSLGLASLFPASTGQIVDIYDPCEMTEPSIERARLLAGATSSSRNPQRFPAHDNQFDAAFLIFSAHELRRPEARVRLFREVARVLRGGGELVLVEHLRDWANFLTFGPGCFHFFSQRTWQAAAQAAGLSIRLHRTITPFVHVFVLQKQP